LLLKIPRISRWRLGLVLCAFFGLVNAVPSRALADAPLAERTVSLGGFTLSSAYAVDYTALGYPAYQLTDSHNGLQAGHG